MSKYHTITVSRYFDIKTLENNTDGSNPSSSLGSNFSEKQEFVPRTFIIHHFELFI